MDQAAHDLDVMSDWQDTMLELLNGESRNLDVFMADEDGHDRPKTIPYRCQFCKLDSYKHLAPVNRVPNNPNNGLINVDKIAKHIFSCHPETPMGFKTRVFANEYEASILLQDKIHSRYEELGQRHMPSRAEVLLDLRAGTVPSMLKALAR